MYIRILYFNLLNFMASFSPFFHPVGVHVNGNSTHQHIKPPPPAWCHLLTQRVFMPSQGPDCLWRPPTQSQYQLPLIGA